MGITFSKTSISSYITEKNPLVCTTVIPTDTSTVIPTDTSPVIHPVIPTDTTSATINVEIINNNNNNTEITFFDPSGNPVFTSSSKPSSTSEKTRSEPQHAVIAFGGKPSAGKDTACILLSNYFKQHGRKSFIVKFADDIYKIHNCIINGAPWEKDSYTKEFIAAVEKIPVKKYDINVRKDRELLNEIGAIGRSINEDFWVARTKAKIDRILEKDPRAIILISDLRFLNEKAYVTDEMRGFACIIERDVTFPCDIDTGTAPGDDLDNGSLLKIKNSGPGTLLGSLGTIIDFGAILSRTDPNN